MQIQLKPNINWNIYFMCINIQDTEFTMLRWPQVWQTGVKSDIPKPLVIHRDFWDVLMAKSLKKTNIG